jgi:dTDP-4-amino-4,6-dideoxygalactose transaminase
MPIAFLDLTRQHKQLETELTVALQRVVERGQFILGDEVAAFETEWANYCSAPDAVGVGNGTDALTLALVASGAIRRGKGDEVITTPLTAGYTALAILNAGGIPVFADIDAETYTLDPNSVARMITSRTRAIVPVHLYGQMCDMTGLSEVAESRRLIILEDAAQAHGVHKGSHPVGSFSSGAAFSFYPTKNLGAYGDGGAVVSQDKQLIEQVRVLREGGNERAMGESSEGRNSRLDELQAAVLRVKLRHLDRFLDHRKSNAQFYNERLASVPDLRLPVVRDDDTHVYHLYVVQHSERDRLRAHLAEHGIETKVHYSTLLHQQRLFYRSEQTPLPVAEAVAPNLLSLPLYAELEAAELEAVADAVLSFR